MSGMTQYLQKKLLDHTLGIAAFTMPTVVTLSLFTASPTDSGLHTSEVPAAVGYARQTLIAQMGATDLTTGVSVNTGTITFGPASADWGTITQIAVEDNATIGAGNMMLWGTPTTSRVINNGESFQLAPSQFSLVFD